MDSAQNQKPQLTANRQPVRTQPVRLPQATAELVNRMLAARCGGSRAAAVHA